MADSSYRKVDVDNLDEDQFREEDAVVAQKPEDGSNNISIETQVRERTQAVKNAIQKADFTNAVKNALGTPPGPKDSQQVKEENLKTVVDALSAVKTTDIGNIAKVLNEDQVDILMQYLYRAMENPEKFNASILLQWHEKALEAGGVGSIVRVMTNRNHV